MDAQGLYIYKKLNEIILLAAGAENALVISPP
jgi:hypothetical protein